jgi:tRNA pseudouridine38-40 synthase
LRAKARQTSPRDARVALAFAYDGSCFDSFARQPGHRTVEGELLKVLAAAGAIGSAASAHYEVASRTDAGVSAAWNVCAVDSSMDPRRLAHVEHEVEGLWLLSAVRVPEGFSPRREATSKRYVFFVDEAASYDWRAIEGLAQAFVGEHDFRNFCRPDRGVPTRRSLTRIEVQPGELIFEAPGFLWEQVRRITGALLGVGAGTLDPAVVRRRLDHPGRIDPQAPAASQGLVLSDVRLGIDWPATSKAMGRSLAAASRSARLRARFHEVLLAKAPTRRR